jgi:hypothetical protein
MPELPNDPLASFPSPGTWPSPGASDHQARAKRRAGPMARGCGQFFYIAGRAGDAARPLRFGTVWATSR